MKVIIRKASLPTYWYANRIGEIFEVLTEPYASGDLIVINEDLKDKYGRPTSMINPDDCEELWNCDWCGELTDIDDLGNPPPHDFASGKYMCKNCWELDREAMKGAFDHDIGPFKSAGLVSGEQ